MKTKLSKPEKAYLEALFSDSEKALHWGKMDLRITEDDKGLSWDGSEKTYDMVEQVNVIILEMKKIKSSFALEGELHAQGEDMDDRWILRINDETGLAEKLDVPAVGQNIKCPECGHAFTLEAQRD